MQKVYDAAGELVAIIANESEFQSGYGFLSQEDWGLQVGINVYQPGNSCPPHEHIGKSDEDLRTLIGQAMEVLYLIEGECEIEIFASSGILLNASIVKSGDVILLICGWHGLRFLTRTKIFECKQGPYINREKDKRFLNT